MKTLIKENEMCPECKSGIMKKSGNILHCNICGIIAQQVEESEFYEIKKESYLLKES